MWKPLPVSNPQGGKFGQISFHPSSKGRPFFLIVSVIVPIFFKFFHHPFFLDIDLFICCFLKSLTQSCQATFSSDTINNRLSNTILVVSLTGRKRLGSILGRQLCWGGNAVPSSMLSPWGWHRQRPALVFPPAPPAGGFFPALSSRLAADRAGLDARRPGVC